MFDWPLLSLLIWIPILGAALIAAIGTSLPKLVRPLALIFAVVSVLLAVVLYAGFDTTTTAKQFEEQVLWIAALNVYYHLGIDGLSLPLILLTTPISLLIIVASWCIKDRPHLYIGCFLLLQGLMIGVFSSLDALLFYVFFEAMLVPMFLIIGIWGGPNRIYATIKLFLFTFLGSVFMLVALLWLYLQAGSFQILDFHELPIALNAQILIFLAFLFAFGVKLPMWPVHTWLPDAHVEAPTGGSVVLAAIMLKIGGYGFVRFALPITPDAAAALDWLVIGLSLVAIAYIGFVALAQSDMKKLIAYSSIAHMGFVTLGFFLAFAIARNTGSVTGAGLGMTGAMVQMISHAFVSGAMFFIVGMLYDRVHSRDMASYGGVANTMPWLGMFAVLFFMANSGLPGTSGFVGEFMVIMAAFQANFWFAFVAGSSLLLGAAYSLWLVRKVFYGEVSNNAVAGLKDMDGREWFLLVTLAFFVLAIGIWPYPLIEMMEVSVGHLVEHIMVSKVGG